MWYFSHSRKYRILSQTCFENGINRGPEGSIVKKLSNDILFGFHRLAINGLNTMSNQPIMVDNIVLICNGEIYNYKELYRLSNTTPTTNSDCEVIIHIYKKYGIVTTLNLLDGVFGFVLYDRNKEEIYVARDPYGVRPLYMGVVMPTSIALNNTSYIFSSEMKMIYQDIPDIKVTCFPPGHYVNLVKNEGWVYEFKYVLVNVFNLGRQ